MQKHVKDSYNVPERHFHTMEHLSLGFKDIAEYSSWYIKNISNSENDIGVNINQIAAWFYHDIYYDAKNPDLNELKSAEIARESLKNIKEIDVDIVCNIIMDTKEHKSTLPQSELILDIDMASLGYDYEKFLYYRTKARNEYELFYNDEQLKVGTIAFLKKTLESDKLYNLDYFKDKYEIQAKNNLFKYLNYLEK
jgi:predicted metal-dependent HD superfamily phosphohydrolase